MKKHIIWGLALALAMVLCASVALAQETVIDFEDGDLSAFIQSGTSTQTIVTDDVHSGSNALLVSQRTTNNWDSIDLLYEAVGLQAGDQVSISFWAKAADAGQIVLGNGGGDYATLIAADVEANTWTLIEGEFVVGETPINLRFQTDNALIGKDYWIDDIVINNYDTSLSREVYTFDFEDGENPGFFQSGTCSIDVTDGALVVSQRTTNDWDAADFPFETLGLQAGDTVKITFDAIQKGSEAGQIQVGEGGGSYATLIGTEVQPNEWTRVSGTFEVGENPVNLRFKTDTVIVGAEYAIDNLKIEVIRPAVTIYSYFFDFEDGENPGFFQSGTCTIEVKDGALSISQRTTNNWDAADLGAADLGIAAGDTVKVSFDVYVDSDVAGVAAVGEGGGSYADVVPGEVEPKTWTTVSGEYVQSDKEPNLRFKLSDELIGFDYQIDNLKIEVVKPYLVKTYSNDLENGLDAFIQSGSCSVVASDKANSGEASIGCEQRTTNDWDALDLLLEACGIQAGDHVKMSFYLYADTADEGDWGVGEGGGSYATLISATIPGREWTKIEGEFDVADSAPNLRFKSMSTEMIGVSFYVDDIEIEFYTVPKDPDEDVITANAVPGADNFDAAEVNEMSNGATFQVTYDGTFVYIKAFVPDTTEDKNDYVAVFVDGMNTKTKRAKAEEVEGGYIVTVTSVCPASAGDKLKFDVITVDASGDSVSWAGSEVVDSTELHEMGRVLMGE